MKKMKKVLALTACAAMLVVGSVAGTLAYLTSSASVENTFTVGNVTITMDEINVDGKDASGVANAGSTRDVANTYHLTPGSTYVKDPTVHVANSSEECYVFVKITNEIKNIEDASSKIENQITDKGWLRLDNVDNVYYKQWAPSVPADPAEAATYLAGTTDLVVFDNFKIDGSVNNTTLAGYADKTITVKAYAIQEDNFASASAAWEGLGTLKDN